MYNALGHTHKQVYLLHSNSSSKGFLSKIEMEVTPPKKVITNDQDVSANVKKTTYWAKNC